MENVKIENMQHAENQTCLLEESDSQCGYVFYNEISRLLKFYCTYCRESYDNIEYFCQHLSDHINESNQIYNEVELQLCKKQEPEIKDVEKIRNSEDASLILLKNSDEFEINSAQTHDENTEDAFEYQYQSEEVSLINENIDSEQIVDNLNSEEMFIEEIDDNEEILDEVEQEMIEEMEEKGTNNLFPHENCSSAEIIEYDKDHNNVNAKTIKLVDDVKVGNSFEECFIKETNIDKIRSEGVCVLKEKNHEGSKLLQTKRSSIHDLLRFKRRRRKVTTVKVIAVKNRIAELYEKIQNEQQKSQQFFSNDFLNVQHEQETEDAIESLIKDEEEANNNINIMSKNHTTTDNKSSQATAEISRQIIGETLITLIPEGTKIPDKMPSPINTNKEHVSNEQSPTKNTSIYNHYKAEDKIEKKAICPACGKIFRSHFSLTIHKRIHYLESDSSVKLAHKCSDCDQLFNKLSQLKHHVETAHYPEGFICKICNRQLSSLSLLERHMVKVHLDRPFNCKKCNKNFSDPLTFEEHLASHNSDEVFKCTTCGRKYSTEYFLLEHMRNHKEQVPQTCVVCGKVTLRITQHMKIHTPRPKRLLSCSECGKVFNFSSGLSHHFKIMHKLPRPPPKLKKEIHANTFKRKRRSRTNERSMNKKKQKSNLSSTDPTFIIDNEKFQDQIIEEQIEISQDVYGTTTNRPLSNLERKENQNINEAENLQTSSHAYISNSHGNNQVVIQHFEQDDAIYHKEEEAKRVIVELIQNSTYTSFFPDHLSSVLEITPPIAREETISAVNSIVHE